MNMHTIICPAPGSLVMETRQPPARAPGQVLIRIRRVGMCGTDYHGFKGTQPFFDYPRVLGHELSGEVVEGDEERRFRPGQIVTILPYLSCGTCIACRRHKPNCCTRIEVLGVHRDGGLAEYLAVDAGFVIDASGLTLDEAAMVEFLSIGCHAVCRASVLKDERVLVTGAGPIGMAVTHFAAQRGAQVTILEGNADRARFCLDQLGAASWVVPGEAAPGELDTLSEGDGFDIVFDATGNPAAMEQGFHYVAHGGRYVLVSVVNGDLRFSDPLFHKREMSLLASRNATRSNFETVIAQMRAGLIPAKAMHTHGARLEELPTVIEGWMDPKAGVIKAIVEL